MSYTWRSDFEEGETRMACSICGVPYRFPSEITRCDDKLYRCNRTCMEETILSRDRQIAASAKRREQVPPSVGIKPSWEP